MGSSGVKRKGRKHLPKVGTPAEETYALRQAERDVAGNFGLQGRSGAFWVVTVAVVGIAVLSLVILTLR